MVEADAQQPSSSTWEAQPGRDQIVRNREVCSFTAPARHVHGKGTATTSSASSEVPNFSNFRKSSKDCIQNRKCDSQGILLDDLVDQCPNCTNMVKPMDSLYFLTCLLYPRRNSVRWPVIFFFLLAIIAQLPHRSVSASEETNREIVSAWIAVPERNRAVRSLFRPVNDEVIFSSPKQQFSFDEWVNRTQQNGGDFLNHSAYAEGEVLLFRTKKNRHRAIAVMSTHTSSKFSDSLTFKEWLRKVYSQDRALKVSVRTTEVVRQVLQHLYASKDGFRAPIIIHANVFDSGRHSLEKTVDPVVFIRTVHQLLPEAVVSLGWTPSADYSVVNRLDWASTFRLVEYVYDLDQPVIINMKLNDAVHSVDQLEWLLGTDRPSIYLLLKGEITDFIDSDSALQKLRSIGSSSGTGSHKILYDVDESWKARLDRVTPAVSIKKKRSVEPERWQNVVFPSFYAMLSTSVVSSNGVAFLGWPSSLFVREISPSRKSGMVIQLFDTNPDSIDSPIVDDAIEVFVGHNGRVSIENQQANTKDGYHRSSSAKLPAWPCYAFEVFDKGWRVEMDIWSEECPEGDLKDSTVKKVKGEGANYRTFVQLDTPVARSRKTRNVAIGKLGDVSCSITLSLGHKR
ncbi:protein FAM [Ditylenchus destructor]|uniref:Protein FAM n=1 Tax=Ditylenchus destructor TaxID=166010 RepID=A0AAD4NAU1_9BILA|nr:protein FAM [Ditylenchus destructor]